MVRYLTEEDVKSLVTLPEAIELMAAAFRDRANGDAVDVPRRRTRQPQGHLQVLQAAAPRIDAIGFKYYFAGRDARTTLVHLHRLSTGVFEAMIEADWLGITRTAATTALATRLLARADVRIVACFGTGRHAVHQLAAVAAVRPITEARAVGRDPVRRAAFCAEMSERLGIDVRAATSAADALHGADIVNVMTKSSTPVFDGALLEAGQHVNAAGSNALDRRELDVTAIRRSDVIVVDSREVARDECGDLLPAVEAGLVHWDHLRDLGDVLVGHRGGRTSDGQITLFESQGMALEDIYMARHVLDAARIRGTGIELPIPSRAA